MKKLLCCLVGITSIIGYSQEYWQSTNLDDKQLISNKTHLQEENKFYSLDIEEIKQDLSSAPQRNFNYSQNGVSIYLPSVDGTMDEFIVFEASNFEEGLQTRFPQIRTYRGYQADSPNVGVSISIGEQGLQTFKIKTDGTSEFIETVSTDNSLYAIFDKTPFSKNRSFECSTPFADSVLDRNFDPENTQANEGILRTFEMAISVSGEYSEYFGGTIEGALSGINATMARVNFLYEKDLATNFIVIDETVDVIFLDPDTDPYDTAQDNWNSDLETTLNDIIGFENYDIGHLFGSTGGGGNAGCIGCVCGPGKGSGFTSPYDGIPGGDTFDIDYVAHEIGHQLGANHTFSRSEGSGVNVEPGSGSTIMGYAGITGGDTDVQSNSDDYFHYVSIEQIINNLETKDCADITDIANVAPTANAGENYTIPVFTPFVLNGSATDPNGDELTFTWEQIDTSSANGFVIVDPSSTSGPLFRSLLPDESTERYFPSFDKVLSGDLITPFEALPTVSRTMNFAFQVRDNAQPIGQTNADLMSIQVNAAQGAFEITSIEAEEYLISGESYNLTWNTAGTQAAPYNSPTVNIYLSTDNGQNFTLIEEGVDNSGSYVFDIPEGSTTLEGRFLIESVGNIFYTVSKAFPIDYIITIDCETFDATSTNLDIVDGTGTSSPVYGGYTIATVPVTDRESVGDLKLNVDISHTFVADLQVVVLAPGSSTRVLAWDHDCNGQDDINASFSSIEGSIIECSSPVTGTFLPSESFTDAFANESPNGNWIVGVRDGYGQDTGTLNSASLEFCLRTVTPLATDNISDELEVMQVYPNPSNGIFNINSTNNSRIESLYVYDGQGKLVIAQKDAEGANQINLSAYPTGMYILKTVIDGKTFTNKLIVK